jgi:hypothetical protein
LNPYLVRSFVLEICYPLSAVQVQVVTDRSAIGVIGRVRAHGPSGNIPRSSILEIEGIYESARADARADLIRTMEVPLPVFVFLADPLISDMLSNQPYKT